MSVEESNCRVMLLSPPLGLSEGKVRKPQESTQPLGLAYVAAAVRQSGFPVKVLDAYTMGIDAEGIRSQIDSFKPHVLGISTLTPQWPDSEKLAILAKSIDEDVLTVMGGAHSTALPQEVAGNPAVDIVVLGEGEMAIQDICETVAGSGDFQNIKGLVLGLDHQIIETEPRPKLMELDTLAFPAHDLLPPPSVYNPLPTWGKRGGFSSIISGRGCPYNCCFCDVTAQQGSRYRLRSAENIVDEMEWLYDEFGVSMFSFRDPSMVCNRKRLIKLCRLILDRDLKVTWNCNSRANEVTLETLVEMQKAGCYQIKYGIEVGNEEMLQDIKSLGKQQVIDAVSNTKKAGISPHGYFMFGFSQETKKTMQETIDFALELELDSAGFMIMVPFPGTAEFDLYKREGLLLTEDWQQYNYMKKPVYRNRFITTDDLLKAHSRAYRKFYFRPRILAMHLKKAASPKLFMNYLYNARLIFKRGN